MTESRFDYVFGAVGGAAFKAYLLQSSKEQLQKGENNWKTDGAKQAEEFVSHFENDPPTNGMSEQEYRDKLKAELPAILAHCKKNYEEMVGKK